MLACSACPLQAQTTYSCVGLGALWLQNWCLFDGDYLYPTTLSQLLIHICSQSTENGSRILIMWPWHTTHITMKTKLKSTRPHAIHQTSPKPWLVAAFVKANGSTIAVPFLYIAVPLLYIFFFLYFCCFTWTFRVIFLHGWDHYPISEITHGLGLLVDTNLKFHCHNCCVVRKGGGLAQNFLKSTAEEQIL